MGKLLAVIVISNVILVLVQPLTVLLAQDHTSIHTFIKDNVFINVQMDYMLI